MHIAQVSRESTLASTANSLANRISAFLATETSGPLLFGAGNEPLWRSQIEAVEATGSYLKQGNTLGHIVQVGGSGKTREAILLSMLAHQDGAKSLFIVPTQQAVIDFSNKAKLLCPELEIGSVYSDSKTLGNLTFITYASALRLTLGKQAKEEAEQFEKTFDESQKAVPERITIDPSRYSLIHWDENHWYITPSATKLLEQFSHAVNIGYTATPRYYSGKEVSNVFGECIYELEFDVALERKEISPYSNILLRSNIETNLENVHPMLECSEEVAQVINTTERNLIFPDFYKNAEITVNDRRHSLLGEPAIVFGTTISHVHHLADVFNHSLMPHLKTDSSFRQRLQEKGIDPEKVEKIAEAIHADGNEYHSGMSASEREDLIKKYEQRKVLCLVSTSLLQQSFDSKRTSVVIDTVPRQTYVGVGQAGMRALRFLPEKHAFIINTEDADRTSLCFNDCVKSRGFEEGIAVEILSGDKASEEKARLIRSDEKFAIPQYAAVAGYEFEILRSVRSPVAEGAFYRTDFENSFRKFSSIGYELMRELIQKMAANPDSTAFVSEFLEIVYPWFTTTSERMKHRFLGSGSELMCADEICFDTLRETIDKIRFGALVTWAQFNTRFQVTLRNKLMSLHKKVQTLNLESLNAEIAEPEYSYDELERFPSARADFNGAALTTLERSNLVPSYEDDHLLEDLDLRELKTGLREVLNSLSHREQQIIKLRYGLSKDDDTCYSANQIAPLLGKCGQTIRNIEAKAIRKLQQPTRASRIVKFVEHKTNSGAPVPDNSSEITEVAVEGNTIADLSRAAQLPRALTEIQNAQLAITKILFDGKELSFNHVLSIIGVKRSELAGLTRSLLVSDIQASLRTHTASKIIAHKEQLALGDSDGIGIINAETRIYKWMRKLLS